MFPSKTPELPLLSPRTGRMSLRLRLALLVAGTCLPLILFTAGLVYLNYVRDREAAFDRVLDTVRSVRIVLDAKMQGIVAALEVLANSNAMRRNDLDGVRANIEIFLKNYPESAIAMGDRDGNQVFNSALPPGAPLPRRTNLETIEAVFRTGKPVFSNLFVGSVSKRRVIAISVPVHRDGVIVADLSFGLPLQLFQDIITEQNPPGWTFSIFDRTGTNFARMPNPELTIGQKASPTLLPALLSSQSEGKLPTFSLEGVPLLTAFTHSSLTGWSVAAGTPVSTLTAPLWRILAVTAGIATILLSIGLAFAIGMAARIARGEALLTLMVNELTHRVKNTLATVQSIAGQTFRNSADPAEATRKFDERLRALGDVYDLLSGERWANADLREIVHDALEPFAASGTHRVKISGPEIRLAPRAALMVSLVLHELATNATKYGALSVPAGQVSVSWMPVEPDRMQLIWREQGGPPTQPPTRRGFGSRLIEEGFPAQLRARATMDFRDGGLVCTLECPRSSADEEPS
jgi:two-component sensor histidine kinase